MVNRDLIRPVCAPQLVKGVKLPMAADDILDLPLASAQKWPEDWAAWAKSAGARSHGDVEAVRYESRAFMFDAALSGQAVVLADARMTHADERAGRLVHLNPQAIERPHGIFVVTSERNSDPRLDVFVDWLRQEAGTAAN